MPEHNWTCPFCGSFQTVIDGKKSHISQRLLVGDNVHGTIGLTVYAIGCSNPKCKEVFVQAWIGKGEDSRGNYHLKDKISQHNLRPESFAKLQPAFIPAPLVADYYEACRIRDLSPKASATLARRCIQGMIRDFCKIAMPTLYAEIEQLKERTEEGTAPPGVSLESVEATHHVREIGNIGAHMEKDINLIVDVDPGEAQALIELIELLFAEWYVAREVRQERLKKVRLIAETKEVAKNAKPDEQSPTGGD